MNRTAWTAIAVFLLVPGAAMAQRSPVSRQFPIYANGGRPDLTVDPQRFVSQMEIVDRLFQPGDCELDEGTVGGTGYRRLLRFDTVIINAGDGDLLVGDPADPNGPYYSNFFFAECHQHYHNQGFSDYKLLKLDGTVAAPGHKQAFCLEDNLRYSNDAHRQFVKGDYIVRVRINAIGLFNEGENRYPDTISAPVHVPDPRKKVTIDDSPSLQSQ